MSEYTTRQILDMIEANGGPEDLDLMERRLSGVDLSLETVKVELERLREENTGIQPVWWSPFGGIHLS
jgi:hypothetical protein